MGRPKKPAPRPPKYPVPGRGRGARIKINTLKLVERMHPLVRDGEKRVHGAAVQVLADAAAEFRAGGHDSSWLDSVNIPHLCKAYKEWKPVLVHLQDGGPDPAGEIPFEFEDGSPTDGPLDHGAVADMFEGDGDLSGDISLFDYVLGERGDCFDIDLSCPRWWHGDDLD